MSGLRYFADNMLALIEAERAVASATNAVNRAIEAASWREKEAAQIRSDVLRSFRGDRFPPSYHKAEEAMIGATETVLAAKEIGKTLQLG